MEKIEVGEIFSIIDADEEEQDVEVLGIMEIDGREYVAVAFVEELIKESEEDIDLFFLRVDEDGEVEAIESDDEFEKVSAAFETILDSEDE